MLSLFPGKCLPENVRDVLWRDNLFFWKEFSDPSLKIHLEDAGMKDLLRNLLAKMLSEAA